MQAAALPAGYTEGEALKRRRETHGRTGVSLRWAVSRREVVRRLLYAVANVTTRMPGAKLRIVGGGAQDEFLRGLAQRLCITGSVEFVGSLDIEALAGEYAKATCFVLPSRSEPWELVVNEALHFGCPVVVSDNCGYVPELMAVGITGFVFRTGDMQDLSNKLSKAVSVFTDTTKTAEECLRVISNYVPERSARQTREGCREIL